MKQGRFSALKQILSVVWWFNHAAVRGDSKGERCQPKSGVRKQTEEFVGGGQDCYSWVFFFPYWLRT